MIDPAARTTPSGHAHGCSVHAPQEKASESAASASAARPKSAPAAPNRTVPPRKRAKPPSRPRTPPIPARMARIVIPVGRAALAEPALAGGVQVVGRRRSGRWRSGRRSRIGPAGVPPGAQLGSDRLVFDRSSGHCLPRRFRVGSVPPPSGLPHPSGPNAPDKPDSATRASVSAPVPRPAGPSGGRRPSVHRSSAGSCA